jgi:hypothetical protein
VPNLKDKHSNPTQEQGRHKYPGKDFLGPNVHYFCLLNDTVIDRSRSTLSFIPERNLIAARFSEGGPIGMV